MKIYGYARVDRFAAQPSETLCAPCFKRRFAGVGQPTKVNRSILGYEDITGQVDAQGSTCTCCTKRLVS